MSKMFHPNIYHDGRICLDMLQNQWSSSYDVSAILTVIRTLLGDPNPLSPANAEAAKVFQNEKGLYEMKVKEVVELSIEDETDYYEKAVELKKEEKE